jgi:hypothetical protein
LSEELEGLFGAPDRLDKAAAKSKAMANTDAVKKLADLVGELAGPEE